MIKLSIKQYLKLKYLPEKFDCLSRRITKQNKKIDNVIDSHQYYIAKRLPFVLKHQKEKKDLWKEYQNVKNFLKRFRKQHFVTMSPSKNPNLRKERYIGLFTHVEMTKLRRFLSKPLYRHNRS